MGNKLPKMKKRDNLTPDEEAEVTSPLDNLMNAAVNATKDIEPEDEESTLDVDDNTESKNGEDFGITVSAPKNPVAPKSPTVDIITTINHSCFIGGKPYHFKKGVKTSVPKAVKDILRDAGILAPL